MTGLQVSSFNNLNTLYRENLSYMNVPKKYGLAEIFQNNMLFQREKEIVLWGNAGPDTSVTVSLYKEEDFSSTNDYFPNTEPLLQGNGTADKNGKFLITLPSREAGDGYLLYVIFDSAPEENIWLRHIGFGDIWLAGGQSNMEFFLKYEKDWEETRKLPRNPKIRMYNVPQRAFPGHVTHNTTGCGYWFDDSNPSLETFSAPAYSFAREIQASTGIPIGIIGCNWGGSSASAWVEKEALCTPPLDRYLREYQEALAQIPGEKLAADSLTAWEFEDSAEHRAAFEPLLYGRDRDWQLEYMKIHAGEPVVPMGPYHFNRPSGLYQTMLSELIPLSIKGVLWYQGESDAGDYAFLYDKLLTALIENWRRKWQDSLPFLVVQLAPFGKWLNCDNRCYTIVREKQTYVSKNIPDVYMTSIMDLGSYYDIHPKEKMEVGRRLALLARGHIYGEEGLLCDPPEAVYVTQITDKQIAVTFRHADGLFASDRPSDWCIGLKRPETFHRQASSYENQQSGQAPCLQEQNMKPAIVTVKENHVILTLPDSIPSGYSPAWVSLGWDDYAEIHIFNGAGLSAAPFKMKIQ